MTADMPKTFGELRVEGILGTGGMATVFLVEDASGTRAAVKRLDVTEAEGAARFRREAEILGQIDHPNVVKVRAYESGSPPYYVMDYLPGKCLEEWINEGRVFLEDEVVAMLADLVAALEAIHAIGVIHRDLKPHNLMWDEGGSIVLSDFGIARDLGSTDITQTGGFVGTPLYLAPEQIRRHHVDARCDLYQAGLIAYKLLAGLVPFEKEDILTITMKRVTEPAPPLSTIVPTVSPSFERLIACLLAVEPDDRYQSATELLEDLERIRAGKLPKLHRPLQRKASSPPGGKSPSPVARPLQVAPSAIPSTTLHAAFLGALLGILILAGMWWSGGTGGAATGTLALQQVLVTGRDRQVTFRFRTDRPMRCSIEYGAEPQPNRILRFSGEARREHEGVAEDVDPARLLYYRVVGEDASGRRLVGETRKISLLMGNVFPMSSVRFEGVGDELRVTFDTERTCKSWICLGRDGQVGKAQILSANPVKRHEADVRVPPGSGRLYYRFVFVPEGGMRLSSMTHWIDLQP